MSNNYFKILIKKAPSGAYVLMVRYDKEQIENKRIFDNTYSTLLQKLARDQNPVRGVSIEGEHHYEWDSWLFDSVQSLKICVNYMKYVPKGLYLEIETSSDLKINYDQ